ncbi:ABC transporter related [Methylocella silvestris BL2]|uniref:ABC transporter related n=1 Tax=Methylocella silvestris (strain DSM 15510 / CIP 108128 / LMG 27833 / NCIMB 13906 / BL2) TaxID=395965 RepID=B8ENU2_METSB|nr:heme ABC transporter ATP-binding protein [Methylocella silvestris]ACK50878.1 ABC transporter related [Methylocella silvestris BL2]
MTDAILTAESLTYHVGTSVLIADASLELAGGRMTIVIGPNGAGKSTLLKLLTGELRPKEGGIKLLGENLAAFKPWRLACIRAVMPQSGAVSLPFTVREVAGLGVDGVGRSLSRAEKSAVIGRALETADVSDLASRLIGTLSGGERQRVHFARVLGQIAAGQTVSDRQILFLDEPTANLDLSHQLDLLDAAARLAQEGVAVVAVIHDLNLAAAYADDLIVLKDGRIVARGAPARVMTDALMSAVFRLDVKVGAPPPGNVPFIVPRRRAAAPQR